MPEPPGQTFRGDEPPGAAQPSLRNSIVRGAVAAVILGALVAGVAWFLGDPGAAAGDGRPSTSAVSGPGPRVGKEAPDFRVVQLDGTVAQLSDFRGQPVWLSFWATWCPPCRAESAEIEAASAEYAPAGLVVLAIDVGEDRQTVERYVQKAALTYLIGFDPGEQIAAIYRVSGLPNHFFIDADGVLREWRVGPVDGNSLATSISAIMPSNVAERSTN